MKKFKIIVSKAMHKIWNVYLTVKAKTKEEAEAKALKLAEQYPGNEDIFLQEKAILQLEDSEDWGALELAMHDLSGMIQKREKWVKDNGFS